MKKNVSKENLIELFEKNRDQKIELLDKLCDQLNDISLENQISIFNQKTGEYFHESFGVYFWMNGPTLQITYHFLPEFEKSKKKTKKKKSRK